jgi:uncharacterized protein DUF4288
MSEWFSATARVALWVEGTGVTDYWSVIYVFPAADFADALQRAIQIALAREQEYRNADGQRVAWRLKEISTLDRIADSLEVGAEVHAYSEEATDPGSPSEPPVFKPDDSSPGQTI